MEQIGLKRVIPLQIPRTDKRRRLSDSSKAGDVEVELNCSQPSQNSLSGDGYGSNVESVCSMQQQDTDPAKDTSDTSMDSEMTEYEVSQLSPEKPNPFFSTDDSDEMFEINEIAELGAVVAAVKYNSVINDTDVGQLADTSTEPSTSPTSNSDVDPELPRLDYLDFWTCAQCNAVNGNRHVPFCSKCYQMRKTFFPPRPRRRRNLTKFSSDSGVEASGSLTSQSTPPMSQDVDVVDGPSGSHAGGSQDVSSGETCPVCYEQPINGIFSHGKTAHVYCCFKCAKKIWRRSGKCALCRKKIDRVLRLLSVEKH